MAGVGLWEWDLVADRVRVNDALRRIDFPGDESKGLDDALALIHADDQDAARSALGDIRAGVRSQLMLNLRVRGGNCRWGWVSFYGSVVEYGLDGTPNLLVGFGFEADMRRQVSASRAWPEDVESFLDDVDIAAWWFDKRTGITIRSRRWSMMLGYRPGEIRADTAGWLALVHPDDRAMLIASHKQLDLVRLDHYQHEYRLRCRDGGYLWVLDRARVHARSPDGAVEVSSGLFVDISAQVEARQLLEALSSTDGLTGIANRRSFDEALSSMWETASSTGRPLCLLLIDADFFKPFNDRYGHQAGDDCLRTLALTMSKVLRGGHDLLARYGGEEFAVLLPDCPAAQAMQIACRICQAVRELSLPHATRRIGMPSVTVSIGVACSQDASMSEPGELIGAADRALYDAKGDGRDCVALSSAT